MRRREFMRSGLVSLASVGTLGVSAFSQTRTQGTYVEGQKITLSNRFLDWELLMTRGTVTSTGFRNKLSGRHYELGDSRELLLTFSQAQARVEIPWWNFEIGATDDERPPDQESGYLRGYHREDYPGEEKWGKVENLARGAPKFSKGYGWFRQGFELPKEAQGEPIVFCLGGHDQEDWNEYWAYLNGALVGHWIRSGRWRSPEELMVRPGSAEYGQIRFGGGKKNLLAVRGHQVDNRFENISDEVLDRFLFEGRLVDQFVTVGQPYRRVADFKLRGWRQEADGARPKYAFELVNDEEQLQLTVHYELDEFLRRKWLEIRNTGSDDRLLLDVDLDDFRLQASTNEGDFGMPVIASEEIFCAVEHPAGVNQGMDGRVRLRHFPGKKLAAGAGLQSKVAVVGVGARGEGRQQFSDYIQARSPRKKLLSIYDPLGINGFPDHPCWTLNDDEMLGTMDLLEKWQKQGVKFDYYVPDVGWQDRTGDLTRYWPHCFPDGPQKVIQRANELGMKWGLWFGATWADWSCGLNPKVEPSRVVVPGGKWPQPTYRDGFDEDDFRRQLCLASEPYFTMLRDALFYHIRNLNLRFFKLDTGSYYCNSTEHNHLPGRYSTEANFDAVIEIARAARQAQPDVYIMWYWGIRSPFFLLYGDSIFEKRITLEAASTGDSPTLFFRDGVTLALDQGARFAEFVPPMSKDSLGVWITDTWWGNSMRKERWREAAVMDLGRGNLLFPQIWGDLYSFTDEDVAFLARIQELARQNETIFYRQKRILGDPWKNEIYGYAYFQGAHGFLFMNNVDFQSRPLRLALDERIGLTAPAGTKLKLLSHFPEQARLRKGGRRAFSPGESLDTWLRPFEVAMWEVLPETGGTEAAGLQYRELPADKPDLQSHRLALEPEAIGPGMEIYFSDPDKHLPFRSALRRPTLEELQRMGYQKRILPRRARMPGLGAGSHVLAIVVRLRKDGKWWRHRQPADLIQITGTVGDLPIRFEAVPNFRQTENNQWCPWLVFKNRASSAYAGKELRAAINAYLPPDVECQVEGWVVPQWWQ